MPLTRRRVPLAVVASDNWIEHRGYRFPRRPEDSAMHLSIPARRTDFHALHAEGHFLLPTAGGVRSAKFLEALGFAGFASSNVGLARALKRGDGRVTRAEVLSYLRLLVDSAEIAVNADFEDGFAECPQELAANVRLAIDTGIAGLSLKDARDGVLYSRRQAADHIRAARKAIDQHKADVLLVGRAEGLALGRIDLNDMLGCLMAYADAGADVLCAPGLENADAVLAMVEAVAPKPVDVQLTKPGITAAELGALGVRRISVGEGFLGTGWADFERAAQRFIDFGDLMPPMAPAL